MLPPCGTFDYVVLVPADVREGTFEAKAALREPILATGDDLHDSRPVGHAPRVCVEDAGLTPDANASRPWVCAAGSP